MIQKLIIYLRRFPLLGEILHEKSIGQFKKYLIIGFSSFALEYLIYVGLLLLTGSLKQKVIISSTIAQAIVFCYNFLLNRYWSFQSQVKLGEQLPKYAVIFLFNVTVSNLLLLLLSHQLKMNYYISKVLVMGAIVSWTFIIYKKVVFIAKPTVGNEA